LPYPERRDASGRTTFDQVYGFEKWPWEHKNVRVLRSHPLPKDLPFGVESWHDGVEKLVSRLSADHLSQNVWVMGGPRMINAFLDLHAPDRFCIILVPILLTGGDRLREPVAHMEKLRLERQQASQDGAVELVYTAVR
jgi:dihydrofolate reductase